MECSAGLVFFMQEVMRLKKTSQTTDLVLALFLYIPVIWAALLIAQSLGGGLPELLSNLTAALEQPFQIQWTDKSLLSILVCTGAYLMGLCLYASGQGRTRDGEEHGSAAWGSPRQLNAQFRQKQNKILTRHVRLGLDIITVDDMDVEVPEDVYLAYAQADRRERYIMEEQSSGKLLSLEQMEEDALLPDYVGAETAPSAETEALEREELRNLAEQKQILLLALLSLKDIDRELINALFFDGASTREYAQRMGVSQRAVIKRRDRILRDLKKFFENSSK